MRASVELNEQQIEVIAKTTLEFFRQEEEKQQQKKFDRRLRNIKILLKNYRSFVNHCIDVKMEIDVLNEKLNLDSLDTDEFAVEAIKRSKERTLAMVKFINQMLSVYQVMCNQSSHPEVSRRYLIIHDLYIADRKKGIEEICALHKIAKRTVYKDIDKACEALAVLMFGIDAVRLGK